ncbi:signal peptide peptidase SppA [Caminibacter mediatlanticus TB-2]|uniref:Proteinase IV n=1 Tax=Caminibacter mediatlanticus TB-2 TaxID=391592 RepID=A0AAI9F3B3_9BACT|nr:signal peptide peptidase SppA [Caminibacter mediatlanticus]EDM24456.1 proteinase IV [Caminibacter mediatlanticus TB-2]QCT95105.1 signal peptide peptidase SppA [Caminibacter mediatlanticus TB-2]
MEENQKLKAELKIFKIKALKEKVVLFGVIILIIAEIIFLGSLLKKTLFPTNINLHKPYVAVININKTITVDYIDKITKKMDALLKDKNCKEFLLVFNTPGGSPSASDEFNAYLKYVNKKKRVNVYVESMAASGGYYIISAIKPIVANKNAVVGSIGVIMPHFVLKKLADKIGIEEDSLTIGKYKEPVSLFRKFSDKDKEYLKTHLLLPTYENFLKTVAKDRNISVDKLKQYADGKIYVASIVKGILVDKISTLIDVKEEIKKRLGKNIKFYNISLEKQKVPFFNIKLSSDIGEFLKEIVK